MPPFHRAILESSLYGIIAHATAMINQLQQNGDINVETVTNMELGWRAYTQAYENYWRSCHSSSPL